MNKALMVSAAVLLTVAGSVGSAATGDVYEWVDTNGTVNFTDSLDNIPPPYRAAARKRTVTPPTVMPTETRPADVPAASSPTARDMDREADRWRNRIAGLRTNVQTLTAQIEEKRQRASTIHRRYVLFSKPADRLAANELDAEIERDTKTLAELKESLAALEAEADRLGIPRERR